MTFDQLLKAHAFAHSSTCTARTAGAGTAVSGHEEVIGELVKALHEPYVPQPADPWGPKEVKDGSLTGR